MYELPDLKFSREISAVSIVYTEKQEVLPFAGNIDWNPMHSRGKEISGYYLLVSFIDPSARDSFFASHKVEALKWGMEVGGKPSALIDPKFLEAPSLFSDPEPKKNSEEPATYEDLVAASNSHMRTGGGTTYFFKDTRLVGYGNKASGYFWSRNEKPAPSNFASHLAILARQNAELAKRAASLLGWAPDPLWSSTTPSSVKTNLSLLEVEISQANKFTISKDGDFLNRLESLPFVPTLMKSLEASEGYAPELAEELIALAQHQYELRLDQTDMIQEGGSREEFSILKDLVRAKTFRTGPKDGARVITFVAIRSGDKITPFFAGQSEIRHEHLAYILFHPILNKGLLDWESFRPYLIGGVMAIRYDENSKAQSVQVIQDSMSLFSQKRGEYIRFNMTEAESESAIKALKRTLSIRRTD
jgi:hypothetical protein